MFQACYVFVFDITDRQTSRAFRPAPPMAAGRNGSIGRSSATGAPAGLNLISQGSINPAAVASSLGVGPEASGKTFMHLRAAMV